MCDLRFHQVNSRIVRGAAALVAAIAVMAISACETTSPLEPNDSPYPDRDRVTIYRDDWGVPHVYARDEAAGFFGAGYALAADNLENILNAYLQVSGRASAAMGAALIEADFSALHWRIASDAREAYSRLEPELQANYRAFVAGIERFMQAHPERVPDWAPPLAPWMPIATTHSFVVGISVFQRGQGFDDCQIGGQIDDAIAVPFPTAVTAQEPAGLKVPATASNQWIVSAKRSASGALISWADSHSDFFHQRDEIRLHVGELHTAGIVPAGMAMPIIGHNRDVAWSFTVGGPDVSDCYVVATDPNDPGRYRYDGEWRELVREDVTIGVRGGEPVRRTLEYLEHNGRLNPVVARRDHVAYAIATPHSGAAHAAERTIYGMNTADSVEEWVDAMRHLGLFPENVMAGDRFGNSVYLSVGRVPRRAAGSGSDRPLNGNSSAAAWLGVHPLEDLMQLRDPAIGWMQNNNVAPDTMIPDGGITASDYAGYLFNDVPGRSNLRAERAKRLLAATASMTVADAVEIGMDELWPNTASWQRALRRAVERTDAARTFSPQVSGLLARLLAFDGIAGKDSIAALSWYFWRLAIADRVAARKLDREAFYDAVLSSDVSSNEVDLVLLRALPDAEATLRERFGRADLPFGEVFRIGRGGTSLPLGGVSLPREAGFEPTLRATRCRWNADEDRCDAVFGQRHPMLTVFTDPLMSFSAVPFGQSRDAASPHHSDQSRLASDAKLKPVRFDWASLKPYVVSRLELVVVIQLPAE